MLYKNDELYKLTKGDIDQIRKTFRKFPIRLTYPEGRIVKSKLAHNRLPDKPTSISFPLRGVAKSDTGTDIWRYAENKIVANNGKVRYLPVNFSFSGMQILQDTDMELIWFLQTKSPYILGGANYNGKTPKAIFEDLINKAEIKAQKMAEMATVQALIHSPKVGLTPDKLRKVAKAYFINGVDELTDAQVKIAIDMEVQRDKTNGITKFMDMVEGERMLDVRAIIQSAIDRSIIKFVPKTREWVWVDPDKKNKMERIFQSTPAKDPHEALLDYYFGDKLFAQNLNSILRGDKIVRPGAGDEYGETGEGDQ